ncbi:hypothetical protein CR513_32251, partial [Mucuna pruriens]
MLSNGIDNFNEQKSRDWCNRKDGDKRDGKAAVMVSHPSMSPSVTLTSTLATIMTTGSNSDLQQNTQSSSNARLALMSADTVRDVGWIIDLGNTDYMTTHFVPSLSNNLLSVSQDLSSKEIIGHGIKRRGLYYVDDICSNNALTSQSSTCTKKHQIWMWHRRFGHASFEYIKHLFLSLFLNCNPLDFHCDVCTLAKSHHANYPLSFNMTIEPFTLIHSYVWGPAPIPTLSRYHWFVIFVDDCSRMTWLYLMINKSDVYECFGSFHKMIQTQFSTKVKVLRSNNGSEFDHGIIHEITCPYTP